ncbi:MAG: hypothetical protein NC825_00335 [Candidatus Omnitrophica bacterium]|nr:hypothetical protein [Candidatus Omnitrophota bacterium]
MKWQICYSNRAYKFIKEQKVEDKVREIIRKLILRYAGENIVMDVKKLKGKWYGYHRIRIGNIRMIVKIDRDNSRIIVDTVDFRGNVY